MEKLAIYNKFKEVPEDAQKGFDNGKFKGTDINTMWRIRCLTEEFGPCGLGWYFDIIRTWVEETKATGEQFAFAEIKLYIKADGDWSKGISGTGGNKLCALKKDGSYTTSDEAFKMAITDAFGVACRSLGIGADIYWANDRTKYSTAEEQPATDPKEAKKATPKQIEILAKNYTGENLTKLLEVNNLEKLEDMPMTKASELITKLYAKNKGEKKQ